MSNGPKQASYAEFAAVARSLGHAHRLELIEHLAEGERTVETLAARTGLSIANASLHLQPLRRAGLAASRLDGRRVKYRLADEAVLTLFSSLRKVAQRNVAEIDRIVRSYFVHRDDLEPVSRDKLLQRLRDGQVTVLDVRPADEFAMGHLPGALNVPVDTLEQRLVALEPDQQIVAYCRGATACCRSRRLLSSVNASSTCAGSRTVSRSGGPPGCPWRLVLDALLEQGATRRQQKRG